MAPTRQELFEQLLEREGLATGRRARIPRHAGPREAEASFAQRRVWFAQQLDPASTVYNILLPLRIEGGVSVAALTQALRTIVARHEALRTCFTVVRGKPYQTVRPEVPVEVALADLSEVEGRADALRDVLARSQSLPFALDRAPLFRFTLVHAAAGVDVLLIALHHIIFDFVSSHILFEELTRLYDAYAGGVPCALPDLSIEYLDVSEWQREQLDRQDAASTLAFWKETLGRGDDLPILDALSDRPPTRESKFEPAVEQGVIPPELAQKVRALSRETGLSAFCIWLSAFQLLLHRYTGAHDIVVCVPHAERGEPELERTIGFFVNMIVTTLRVRRRQSFRTLLRGVHEGYLEAIGTHAWPFDKLIEALAPARYEGRTRLGEIGFGYQRVTRATWTLGTSRVTFLDANVPIAKTELAFSIHEGPEQCRAYLEYNGARFSSGVMTRLLEDYGALLAELLETPDRPVGLAGPGVAPAASRAIEPAVAAPACLHEWFSRAARATPDATALVMDGAQVSYRALDARAAAIARDLRQHQVAPHRAVGVSLPRSIDAYACLLAVLRSGAVYVPMDPAHPPAHLRKMIDAAGISHIVAADDAHAAMREALADRDVRVMRVPPAGAADARRHDRENAVPVTGDHLAYVCFTSGTTGDTKGVPIAHGAIAAHIQSFCQALPIDRADRVLQFTAFTFDVAIEQMFTTWSAGATLVCRGDELWGARECLDLFAREQVTIANPPTAYWNELVRSGAAGLRGLDPGAALRRMIVGGEAMLADTARLWARMSGRGVRLINAYGPTEAVVTATVQDVVDPAACEPGTTVSIGQVLPGRLAVLLDREGMPVPRGAPGELCLGGATLAQGYLRNPRLTALRFQPWTDGAPGGRVYRTGDWVRQRPGGRFDYLERRDDEIKVRGVRVSPALIESVLAEHDRIVEAAAVLRDRQATLLDDDGGEDDSAWQAMLARVPAEVVEQAIRDLERAAEREAESPARLSRHAPEFDLVLQLHAAGFVATPKPFQRNWLINRALDEWADDLRALHAAAARFVGGSLRDEIDGDLARHAPDTGHGDLVIARQQVMQDWQRPLMRELARAAAERHGDVLEIGFGLGIAAGMIQQEGVRSHVIVEANETVVEEARAWRRRHAHAGIEVIHGRWQDVVDTLGAFDGILFDAYPLTEAEFRRHVLTDVTFAGHFFASASAHLKPDGIFTYYSNEIESLSRRHQRLLLQSFASFEVRVVRGLRPRDDSQNWWADSMAVVRARGRRPETETGGQDVIDQ